MNLVTYCAPVAIAPKRCMAIGLYRGTLSHDNFLARREGVLQVLQEHHAPLFTLLGKTSARDSDKLGAIAAAHTAAPLTVKFGHTVLSDAAAVMRVVAVSEPLACGDHDVVMVAVEEWENLAAQLQPLYTGRLRELGYMQ